MDIDLGTAEAITIATKTLQFCTVYYQVNNIYIINQINTAMS